MGYRKIDPRTKAAAIKAMRKAIDENGQSAYAAARELSAKYQIGANTLHKYFVEAQPAPEPTTEIVKRDHRQVAATIESATLTTADDSAHRINAAGQLSAEFTSTLETLSAEFVAHLQQAALDDLISRMQELRDSLRS